ncbi:4Fe-4S ferredoxin [Mycobacterium antarcticum]|uniref:4Fe-4S dicluster domain-containing protein n=1 Tax=Mycolicibacterium sp. TUM20983 TaxID=3023369 RepID=UPI002398D2AC|nr:4Fe-4S dicluster domain-containing protein [Mycolicibacterium sp. TUM20983]GLP76735.1 4Fe-4S ferredoxin [Mycolicibacterium sp. TUM20983]
MNTTVIDAGGLRELVSTLIDGGYRVVGPTLSENAIVLDELRSADDLPKGWGVDVGPGHYRLRRRDDDALFGHSAGPQSWKQFLHPARQRVWSSDGVEPDVAPPYAFIGVRACDLAAIAMLNGVLGVGTHPDEGFVGRLGRIFVVAVNCTEPGGLCFCASMNTGPAVGPGYDLALTERIDGDGRRYVVDVGSDAGAAVLAEVVHRDAERAEIDSARKAVAEAADKMGRQMPSGDLRELLVRSRDSPHWQDVADRCLTCGNCTMVCPTCFCTTVEDVTDLTGEHAERWMNWASCYEFDFTFVHEGSTRKSAPSRYRHWLTHKLGTWHDQFGSSGCVGCGRCIAFCPTGIDITEEMTTLAGLDAEDRERDAAAGDG